MFIFTPFHNRERFTPFHNREGSIPVHNRERFTPVHNRERSTPVHNRERFTPVLNRERFTPVHNHICLTIGPIPLAICVLFLFGCPHFFAHLIYFCFLATANIDFSYTKFCRHILKSFIVWNILVIYNSYIIYNVI